MLWIAVDATTKLMPVMQVGGRNQEIAFAVVHELKGRLAAGCVLVFSTIIGSGCMSDHLEIVGSMVILTVEPTILAF
jgi:hypothetical protein